jgi:hypothetical protein
MDDHRLLQLCATVGDGRRIAVDRQQSSARLDGFEQRSRVASGAEGAVDRDRPRPGLKELY